MGNWTKHQPHTVPPLRLRQCIIDRQLLSGRWTVGTVQHIAQPQSVLLMFVSCKGPKLAGHKHLRVKKNHYFLKDANKSQMSSAKLKEWQETWLLKTNLQTGNGKTLLRLPGIGYLSVVETPAVQVFRLPVFHKMLPHLFHLS